MVSSGECHDQFSLRKITGGSMEDGLGWESRVWGRPLEEVEIKCYLCFTHFITSLYFVFQ